MWFQNRRARYFKSKKPSTEALKPSRDHFHTPSPSPPFLHLPPLIPRTPSLPSPPGCPLPSFPQSTSLSTVPGSQAVSPVSAPQGPSCSLHELPAVNQEPDITDYCLDGFPHSGISQWDLTEDFENFLAYAEESGPVGSRWATVPQHRGPKESVQCVLDQLFSSTAESMDDLSELCFQELGDLNLSDLDISAAMIDYLLG